MTFAGIADFLEFCITSYPLPLSLLTLVIGFFVYWFFKVRPKEKEREEAREEANRKREAEFLQVITRSEENHRSTTALYEKALDNSTRAVENNTAALNIMVKEIERGREETARLDDTIEKLQEQERKTEDKVTEILALVKKGG